MRELEDVTVGIKTFYRTVKLRTTLKSLIGLGFGEIMIADDGPEDPEKEQIYREFEKQLPLRVLKLPYDTGLGYGRKKIVENCSTKYLLIIDDDMTVPKNVHFLKVILENNAEIGGVAGCLTEYGKLKCPAHNLYFKKGYIIRDIPDKIKINIAEEIPYIYFDFIPNAALFRMDTLRDYCWDEKYTINFEHLDFYWAHKKLGKWKFAVTPAVFFVHYPGGNKEYIKLRYSKERYKRSKEYFLRKWNLKGVINIQMDLISRSNSLKGLVWYWFKKHAPFRILPYLMKIEESLLYH